VYPDSSRRGSSGQSPANRHTARRLLCFLLPIFFLAVLARSDDQAAKSDKDSKTADEQEKIYEPGGDVKPPKLVHYVEPAFSPSSKEAFVEGTVKISTVITRDGVATSLRVVSGLNSEEDRTAAEAVKQWKFQPGTKAGQPVSVHVTVEVTFHLM
jgi:TonB family protein